MGLKGGKGCSSSHLSFSRTPLKAFFFLGSLLAVDHSLVNYCTCFADSHLPASPNPNPANMSRLFLLHSPAAGSSAISLHIYSPWQNLLAPVHPCVLPLWVQEGLGAFGQTCFLAWKPATMLYIKWDLQELGAPISCRDLRLQFPAPHSGSQLPQHPSVEWGLPAAPLSPLSVPPGSLTCCL